MKGLTLILVILFGAHLAFAQTEVRISNQNEDGLIIDGYKKGVWNYFNNAGEMTLQVNYDNAKILYVQPTSDKFYVRADKKWFSSKVDKQAMYLGSPVEFDQLVHENIRFPEEALKSFSSGKVVVSFVVDKTGSAGQFDVVKDFGFEAGQEVIRVLDEIPNLWIPSEVNGNIVDTKFYISVSFEGQKPMLDEHLIASDPEIPTGRPQLNVAPSVVYYKSYIISSGNGMMAKAKRM